MSQGILYQYRHVPLYTRDFWLLIGLQPPPPPYSWKFNFSRSLVKYLKPNFSYFLSSYLPTIAFVITLQYDVLKCIFSSYLPNILLQHSPHISCV